MKNIANYGEHGELRNVVIHKANECMPCLCSQLRYICVSLIRLLTATLRNTHDSALRAVVMRGVSIDDVRTAYAL